MNHITKRNRLMNAIDSLSAYVPHCPTESKPRLIAEIARMQQEVNRIKCMTLSELQSQVDEYVDTRESKLNFSAKC